MARQRVFPIPRLAVSIALAGLAIGAAVRSAWADPAAENSPSVDRPQWQVGDNWVVETLTEQIQGNESRVGDKAAKVRWQFRVAKLEKLNGRDCYRVDVECMAQGRMQPKSRMWCDKDTLFLRQFETQVAFRGQYHTIQESYDCAKGAESPVLATVNVLPIALPAFLPKGAKALGSFTYVSQAAPAGSKDPDLLRFAHTVKQEVRIPGAKSLEQIRAGFAKDLAAEPAVEVRLDDGRQAVTQLWQKGTPWPVYAENGRTKAWLVSTGKAQ